MSALWNTPPVAGTMAVITSALKTRESTTRENTHVEQFDFAAGHQLQTGQAVPLASFPEGDYRLEIKVTDKISSKTLTRDVNFSVAGA